MATVVSENAPLLRAAPTVAARRNRAVAVAVLAWLAAVPLLILLPLLFSSPAPPPPPQPVSLVAIGDWGRDAQHGQKQVASALASVISTHLNHSAVSIISTGDNFYKSGVSSTRDGKFNSSFEAVYHHPLLQTVPWYVALGNHDHLGDIHAQVAYSKQSKRWNMPLPYFSKRLSPHLMALFLDTTPFVDGAYGKQARIVNRQSPHAQLAWLRKLLRSLDAHTYILVVGHHNMYSMSMDDHLGTPSVRHALEPILKPYSDRLLAYVSGHEHSLMHMQPTVSPHVVDHFLSGAGSKLHRIVEPRAEEREKWYKCCDVLPVLAQPSAPRTVWGRSTNGFFVFDFDGRRFTAKAVDADANVIYSYSKTMR